MNWQKAIDKDDNSYSLPGNWLLIYYFEALNILFRLENSLRIFVYVILKKEFRNNWIDTSLTSDDENQSSINSIAKKRIAQDRNFAYLGLSTNNPLMYLTSGELIRIITSESYWKLFGSYFPGSKEIMKIKLDEIGNVRNSIAHFRPIKEDDVELLKQNAHHTLMNIEVQLSELTECSHVVPTNTVDEWYKKINNIGNEFLTISLHQTKDKNWVKLSLRVTLPVIQTKYFETRIRHRTLKIQATAILTHFPEFKKYVIICSEILPYFKYDPDNPIFPKTLAYIIHRNSLISNGGEIESELKCIVSKISEEVELMKEDNLASGSIIESAIVFANKEEAGDTFYYDLNKQNLKTERTDNDPPEFWGELTSLSTNFISDSEKFPWMKVKIAQDNGLPF